MDFISYVRANFIGSISILHVCHKKCSLARYGRSQQFLALRDACPIVRVSFSGRSSSSFCLFNSLFSFWTKMGFSMDQKTQNSLENTREITEKRINSHAWLLRLFILFHFVLETKDISLRHCGTMWSDERCTKLKSHRKINK